jgi:hypothetical protein
MSDAYNAGRAAGIREAAEVAREIADQYVGYMSRIERAILALLDAPAPAGVTVRGLAFAMYPKDMRGNYEQREDFPEYVRMAEIAIRTLSGNELYQAAKRDAEEAEAYAAELEAALKLHQDLDAISVAAVNSLTAQLAQAVEALELADAALSGANMNMRAVEKKVKAAIAELKEDRGASGEV